MSTNSTQRELTVFEDPMCYVYVIAILFFLPSFVSQVALLIQIRMHKLASDLSANLLINMGCWTFSLFMGLCCGFYMLPVLESPYKSTYYIMYAATAFSASTWSLSISVLFVLVDRIFALLKPLSHKNYRRSFIILTITGCFVVFFVHIAITLIFEPKVEVYTYCKTITCISPPHLTELIAGLRVIICLLNVVASVVFNITLYKYWNRPYIGGASKESFRQANILSLVSCLTEILFSVVPQFIVVLLAVLRFSLNMAGPFMSAAGGFDALVNALIFRHIIMKRVSKPTEVEILSSNLSLGN